MTEVIRAIKFGLFSMSAGLIQIGSFAFFQEVLGCVYWISYLVSLVLSVLWNFTLNRKYTFKSGFDLKRSMFLVFCYYLVFTPLSTYGGNYLVGIGFYAYLVTLGNMLLNLVTEFLFQRYVVYRHQVDTR